MENLLTADFKLVIGLVFGLGIGVPILLLVINSCRKTTKKSAEAEYKKLLHQGYFKRVTLKDN